MSGEPKDADPGEDASKRGAEPSAEASQTVTVDEEEAADLRAALGIPFEAPSAAVAPQRDPLPPAAAAGETRSLDTADAGLGIAVQRIGAGLAGQHRGQRGGRQQQARVADHRGTSFSLTDWPRLAVRPSSILIR